MESLASGVWFIAKLEVGKLFAKCYALSLMCLYFCLPMSSTQNCCVCKVHLRIAFPISGTFRN